MKIRTEIHSYVHGAMLIAVFLTCIKSISSGAVQLTQDNFDNILGSNELVFINFYADWCRFSNMLAPVFDETADKVSAAFPEPGRVILGKVDSDKETSIATRFHITKYPTLKLIRNGQVAKREYRGQRSADAFVKFIEEQLTDPIKEISDLTQLEKLDDKKRNILGYFDSKDSPEYNIFRRVASNLKDDCEFHVGVGEVSRSMHPPNQPIIAFRPAKARSNDIDETFSGNLSIFDELHTWASEKCVPLVREITFENAEELTEEGLPFLILFHHPDDNESVKKYSKVIHEELLGEKQSVNFLTADGLKFAHPLHHLGKNPKDLPLIAIDSFRHMYLFPDIKEMNTPNRLKQFLKDLYTGKLHREFHYGPDPVTDPQPSAPSGSQEGGQDATPTADGQVRKMTSPPESAFKKLAPSKNRYSLRDEL